MSPTPADPIPSPPLPPAQPEEYSTLVSEEVNGGELASEEADRPVPGSALGLKEQYPVRGKRSVCVGGG